MSKQSTTSFISSSWSFLGVLSILEKWDDILYTHNTFLILLSFNIVLENIFVLKNTIVLKNTWKVIKSIISIKSSLQMTPTLLTFQNETIDNPKRIANIFNNYFSIIGKKTQARIKYLHKITLITSQTKTLIPFSSHQQTKKKLS